MMALLASIIVPVKPAIFLDRDGVIIENRVSYVRSWTDVAFLPDAHAALALLARTGYAIVVVTNQSAVGRGLMTLAQAEQINRDIVRVIAVTKGRIDHVYMCPHAPADGCKCRKPRPGLLTQAAEDLDLDLSSSFLIGDALTDLQAAQAAGVPHRIMVRTGRGASQLQLSEASSLPPFTVCNHLLEAIHLILDGRIAQV
jgi:D-glycero-D-manno-heptose 1,7-bisphosphate phosphatase